MAKEISSAFPPGGAVSLWAYDSVNDKWYALLADKDGHLQLDILSVPLPTDAATATKQLADGHNVTVDNADIEVVQPTPADLKIAQHQYDGSAWRKSNLLIGYNDRLAERNVELNGGSSPYVTDRFAVVENYVYVVQALSVTNGTSATTKLEIFVSDGTTYIQLAQSVGGDPYTYLTWQGEVVLKYQDLVRFIITGGSSGDDIYMEMWGYKMKVDM